MLAAAAKPCPEVKLKKEAAPSFRSLVKQFIIASGRRTESLSRGVPRFRCLFADQSARDFDADYADGCLAGRERFSII